MYHSNSSPFVLNEDVIFLKNLNPMDQCKKKAFQTERLFYEILNFYAEFLSAFMIPNEHRITSFSYTFFESSPSPFSSISLTLESPYC